ncbi:hypothetical protein BS47DRAFT_1390518 [Hydnum rufescens UP504]|uniref:Zn(2)-C6 fungal-type domain-containing protein n=1 Tax=Hydnum rufescens UP504 TaxID=1448309 RepID=A0A9P6DWR2_9AGAM|nr:hypothetical protein BS47DRAFT_1390518 [Hydnum rufescens UP504]
MLDTAPLPIFDPYLPRDARSLPRLDPSAFFNDAHDIYSSGDDSSFFDNPSARVRAHQQMLSNPSLPPPRSSTLQRASMHVLDPMNPGALGEAPTHTKRRPKYTRSKAGCLTCRTKKIKCDEIKPICTRCDHAQRECTWPTETNRKKGSRRVRSSTSPEQDVSVQSRSSNRVPHTLPALGSSDQVSQYGLTPSRRLRPSTPSSLSASSASEDTGSALSGTSGVFDDGISSESGDDTRAHLAGSDFRRRRLAGPSHSQVFQPSSSYSGGPYPQFAYGPAPTFSSHVSDPRVPFNLNVRGPVDLSATPLGLSPLSASSSSQVSSASSPSPLYQQPLPMSYPLLNLDPPDFNQLPYPQGGDPSSKWIPSTSLAQSGLPQFAYTPAATSKVDDYNAEYEADPLNISSPSLTNDSYSTPSPEALSVYESATALSHGQWNNTPLVINSGPDPIEPFFRTLKERDLIRHYANFSTDLIMAIHTSAALNPVLASTLPMVLSVLPRQSAPIEALRLSLLGVAAVHQSFLHSRSDPGRSYQQNGALPMTAATKLVPSTSAQASGESLRLGLLLRQNATQCLAYACQTVDGSWSDAALAASVTIALIDIFAGGHGFQSNLLLAKDLIRIRGGPEGILAANAPSRTSFGGGVNVSPARLLLEILAVYDTFGSLTSGEEPALLGKGRPSWWFQEEEGSYHRFSIEKVYGMSRQSLFLIAKVSSLLTRARSLGDTIQFTEEPFDEGSVPADVVALHAEACALLTELEDASRSELAHADSLRALNASLIFLILHVQIVLLRLIFNVERHDQRVQTFAQQILERCLDSAQKMSMCVDLTWPVIIAGCEVDHSYRRMLGIHISCSGSSGHFADHHFTFNLAGSTVVSHRKKCCFDIDTAEQIVNEVWRRVDLSLARADWKCVLEDFDIQVLLL